MFVFVSIERKKLREFTHRELNLAEEAVEPEGIPEKFIVFQKYLAFFYFIPFWPMGKIVAFQKDGHLYQAPENIREHINLEYPVKTPWHYYLGILCMLAVFTGFCFLLQLIGNLLLSHTQI